MKFSSLVMSLLLLGTACSGWIEEDGSFGQKRQASIDLSSPIGLKWLKLGGESVVGMETTSVLTTPNNNAKYQRFANGVIVYSTDFGAVYLSNALFDSWLALRGKTAGNGQDLLDYIDAPVEDFTSAATYQSGKFKRGMIVLENGQPAHVISGEIYLRYTDKQALLGLPRSDEMPAPHGGRSQQFQNGWIYWLGGVGAFEVHGAILDRWNALGGVGGALGYPTTNEEKLVASDGSEIGRSNRFQSGVIFWSSASGAWDVQGALLVAYEGRYGGPGGWLGLPISGQGTAGSGDQFNDFQHGVIVNHLPSDGFHGVLAFGSLDFYVERLQGYGNDCLGCGEQDVYAYINVNTPDGHVVGVRRPNSGSYGGSVDLDEAWPLRPVANSGYWVDAQIDIWDEDTTSSDDHLGTVSYHYSIDNLWGMMDDIMHRDNDGAAWFTVRNHIPFDGNNFRAQLWWSFSNFSTPQLSYDQYAQTFTDVDPDEHWYFHPFNALFYSAIYKGMANGGNCFGMSLESAYAQAGRSAYAEPIFQYFPDTASGPELSPVDPAHAALINEINIKHGYQLGAPSALWTAAMFVSGQTHDPKNNFILSQAFADLGDRPVLSIFNSYLFGGAHTLRPHTWETNQPCKVVSNGNRCWHIQVGDPNDPWAFHSLSPTTFIEVDPVTNQYTYDDLFSGHYDGGEWSGGRMFFTPFALLSSQPRTLIDEVLALIVGGIVVIVGDTAAAQQITDQDGRTFFESGLAGIPTRWDEIRKDDASRVPNLSPLVMSDGIPGPQPQIYFAQGSGMSHRYDVTPAPGVAAGTPYDLVINSGTLSSALSIPGTPGKADAITARNIDTESKAIAVAIPSDGVAKQISWTVAGPEKHRWAQLTNLKLVPTQELAVHVENNGYKLVFDNKGPETTADLTVNAGPDATPVVVGTVTIPANSKGTTFHFDAPVTTLTTSGTVLGNGGWLIAPVTITLTAKDFSSKGINFIEYSRDDTNWTKYAAPFVYADEGATTLHYRARDNAGGLEVSKSFELKIDTRTPVVTVWTDFPRYTRVQSFVVHFGATDPMPGSGLKSVNATLDGATVIDGQTVNLFSFGLGPHTETATAEDVAGWKNTESASFEVIATLGSLKDTITALRSSGDISKDGIEQSLLAKVSAAMASQDRGQRATALNQLEALLNELQAQDGKQISHNAAQLLDADVRYVMAHLP